MKRGGSRSSRRARQHVKLRKSNEFHFDRVSGRIGQALRIGGRRRTITGVASALPFRGFAGQPLRAKFAFRLRMET